MDIRFQRILMMKIINNGFKSRIWLVALLIVMPSQSLFAAETEIKPNVERREMLEDILDSENFEIGVKVGVISI